MDATRQANPAPISFRGPNFAIKVPKNRFTMAVVTKRQLSLMENKLRWIPSASVMADKYKGFVLLQKPSVIITITKQDTTITHL